MYDLSLNPYFWLVYFSLAVAMGYWNYRRGHHFMIGVFVSSLLTPVAGLLFNIFAKPNTDLMRKRARPVKCPSCGEDTPAHKTRCIHCGKRLKEKNVDSR
ncbi:MAG TPA: hypothetical protein VKS81_10865 [Bacteroidota bacterium]|nr:hypothetical protein [Bacteroidota bacterium]